MSKRTAPPTEVEVSIRVARDEDARRITSILHALGYKVLRQLDDIAGPRRMNLAADEIARRHKFTERETDIIKLFLAGKSRAEIAKSIGVCPATVKWHMHNIFAKTNTHRREQLLRLALTIVGS